MRITKITKFPSIEKTNKFLMQICANENANFEYLDLKIIDDEIILIFKANI